MDNRVPAPLGQNDRRPGTKPEARNPKFETNTNEEKQAKLETGSFRTWVLNFLPASGFVLPAFVSDFVLSISDFYLEVTGRETCDELRRTRARHTRALFSAVDSEVQGRIGSRFEIHRGDAEDAETK